MLLNFVEGSSRDGDFIVGFRKKWHFRKNGGSYKEGRDFFYIHYHLRKNKPHEVLLHVDAPKTKDNVELNRLKQNICEEFISAMDNSLVSEWSIRLGRRSSIKCIQNYKSTTILGFSVPEQFNHLIGDYEETINKLDITIGETIDNIYDKYRQELEKSGYFESNKCI